MIKFGLEQEFFVQDINNNFVFPAEAGLHIQKCDECGYLSEARGGSHSNIITAVFSLKEDVYRIKSLLKPGYKLSEEYSVKLPKQLLHQATRTYGKGTSQDLCMYGEIKPKSVQTAGLHIHFSDVRQIETTSQVCETCGRFDTKIYDVPQMMDIPRIVGFLDRKFDALIKFTKRQKGIYELKPWGFEYRSLPNCTNYFEIVSVIQELFSKEEK